MTWGLIQANVHSGTWAKIRESLEFRVVPWTSEGPAGTEWWVESRRQDSQQEELSFRRRGSCYRGTDQECLLLCFSSLLTGRSLRQKTRRSQLAGKTSRKPAENVFRDKSIPTMTSNGSAPISIPIKNEGVVFVFPWALLNSFQCQLPAYWEELHFHVSQDKPRPLRSNLILSFSISPLLPLWHLQLPVGERENSQKKKLIWVGPSSHTPHPRSL